MATKNLFRQIRIAFLHVIFSLEALRVAAAESHSHDSEECICGTLEERPDVLDRLGVARWLVHSLQMGVLSTMSTKAGPTLGAPFGNIYSFVDGPCEKSTGIPYFYASLLDQSAKDAAVNPRVSLTVTEAFLSTTCHRWPQPMACATTNHGDPESPVCARLVMSGNWVVVDSSDEVYRWAKKALFERHPVMASWPSNHDWLITRLEIDDLWFIDYFGGAYQLDVEEYLQFTWPPAYQSNSIKKQTNFYF
eukprot:scaffold2510_cov169-Amphora_coffeaeformis.AAC.63